MGLWIIFFGQKPVFNFTYHSDSELEVGQVIEDQYGRRYKITRTHPRVGERVHTAAAQQLAA